MDPIAPQLIGNLSVRNYLRTLLTRGTVNGSYLFVGPTRTGKRSTAEAFAQALQCQGTPESAPCGACASCQEWRKGLPADTIVIEREPDHEAIRLDQIRPTSGGRNVEETLQHRLGVRPLFSRRHVVIIDEAQRLNSASANALLKTLEEPTGQTILILTAEHEEDLPKTIVSRCARILFSRVPDQELRLALRERTDAPRDQVDLAMLFSDGRPGEALRLLRDPDALAESRDLLSTLTDALGDSHRPFELVQRLIPTPGRAVDRLEGILAMLARLLHELNVRVCGAGQLGQHRVAAAALDRLAARLSFADLAFLIDEYMKLRSRLDRNVNPRTSLDAFTSSFAFYAT